ncbi:hypothetical protein HGRIS_004428 [Hohenbuehelia grisea]|uniref:C2H2-type domain-containing protein n=1 Tax=Hohenbuehelia grisea TaxID=104357 RepID=A0ABR3JC87_9AGAR
MRSQYEDQFSPLSVAGASSFDEADDEERLYVGGEESAVQSIESYIQNLQDLFHLSGPEPVVDARLSEYPEPERLHSVSRYGYSIPSSTADAPPLPMHVQISNDFAYLPTYRNHVPQSMSPSSSLQVNMGIAPSTTYLSRQSHGLPPSHHHHPSYSTRNPYATSDAHGYPVSKASPVVAPAFSQSLPSPSFHGAVAERPEHFGTALSGSAPQMIHIDGIPPSPSAHPSYSHAHLPPQHQLQAQLPHTNPLTSPNPGGSAAMARPPQSVSRSRISSDQRFSVSYDHIQPFTLLGSHPILCLSQRSANLPVDDGPGLYAQHPSHASFGPGPSPTQFIDPEDDNAQYNRSAEVSALNTSSRTDQLSPSVISGSLGPANPTDTSDMAAPSVGSLFRQTVASLKTRSAARKRRKNKDEPGKFQCDICGDDLTSKINLKRLFIYHRHS